MFSDQTMVSITNRPRGDQLKTGDSFWKGKQTQEGDLGWRQLWILHAQLVPHKETGDGVGMFALRGCLRVLLSPGTSSLSKIRTWPGGLGNIGQPPADVRLSFVADFAVAAPRDKTAVRGAPATER